MMGERRRYAVDSWDPGYGSSMATSLDEAHADLDLEVEVGLAGWAPRDADVPAAGDVVFVDGVRRIDARVWATAARTRPALAVSYAAGAVRCNGRAEVVATEVRRVLVGRAGLDRLAHGALTWTPLAAQDDDQDSLVASVQQAMGQLEAEVTVGLPDTELLVVDGPLTGRTHLRGAIGWVKTHRTAYLPEEVEPVVRELQPGQRTPVFLLRTNWERWSWYLRLPGGSGHPWAGVVRIEAMPTLALEDAVTLAGATAATLPRFASPVHRDARAPANLLPIAGLEDRLHHLLGDRDIVVRHLRRAAAAGSHPAA